MAVALDCGISEKYLKRGARVAVALSGGADSVCLLSLMKELSKKKGFELFALHLNHCIRGDEADRDERFCRELCERLCVPIMVERADVPALAKEKGQSLEEAAREARYGFFESTMCRENIPVIATAHNADDNAETVLLRIIRGASLDGICGIRAERPISGGLTVIRPILGSSKRDILAYCEKNGLPYVTDSTNACIDYPRNRIRARVLPEAETINPSFLTVNRRNCDQLLRDADFIGCEADKLYGEASGDGVLRLLPLVGRHRALTSRVASRFCLECGASPERKHIEAICDAIDKGGSYSQSIPDSKRVVIDGGVMYVCPDVRTKRTNRAVDGYFLSLGIGETRYEKDGLTLDISVEAVSDASGISEYEEISHDSGYVYTLSARRILKFDTSRGAVFARSRQPNDKIDLGSFHKDLRQAMSEKKIPSLLRGVLPLICDGDGIVYAPGVGCRRPRTGLRDCTVVTISLRLDTRPGAKT